MICQECKQKSIARGIKIVQCHVCGDGRAMVNSSYKADICPNCSANTNICQRCGRMVVPKKTPSTTSPEPGREKLEDAIEEMTEAVAYNPHLNKALQTILDSLERVRY